jgi:hypothetical protein
MRVEFPFSVVDFIWNVMTYAQKPDFYGVWYIWASTSSLNNGEAFSQWPLLRHGKQKELSNIFNCWVWQINLFRICWEVSDKIYVG